MNLKTIAVILSLLSLQSYSADFTVTNNTGGWQNGQPGPYTANTFWDAIRQVNAAGGGYHRIFINVNMAAGGTNPAAFTLNNITADSILIDGSGAPGGRAIIYHPGYGAWNISAGVKRVVFRNVAILPGAPGTITMTLDGDGYHRFENSKLSGLLVTFTKPNTRIINSLINGSSRVVLNGSDGSVIRSSRFNTDLAGTATVASTVNEPLFITGSNNVTIGGNASADGNQFGGVSTSYLGTSGTCNNLTIRNNFFGSNNTGLAALGSLTGSGLLLSGTLGSANISDNVVLGANIDKAGIEFNTATVTNLTLSNNKIGVNLNGLLANATAPHFGNLGSGIMFTSGFVGTNSVISNNIVSLNRQHGINILCPINGLSVTNNTVGLKGDRINVATNYGNGFSGIIAALNSSIANYTVNQNYVSNNGRSATDPSFQREACGIIINFPTPGSVASATITQNTVGVDISGNASGNLFAGIYLFQCGNMGGGDPAKIQITNNVSCDNGKTSGTFLKSHGIAVNLSQNYTISGNTIGTDGSGGNLGNHANGIELNQANNGVITGNSIRFNKGNRTTAQSTGCGGIVSFNSQRIFIQGNFISDHTNFSGSSAPNNGIVIERGSGVLIGGTSTGEANTITNNSTHGIWVVDGADNVEIRRNIITCNGEMGISLNIAGDPGTVGAKTAGNSSYASPGPVLNNPGSNCPGAGNPGSGIISGTAPANSIIELFESPACKTCPSPKRGESAVYKDQFTANGTGNYSYTGATGNPSITATSPSTTTVLGFNFRKTSRFSNCEICSLPLEWLSTRANRKDAKVEVSWITAKESNVSHFVVERSDDGVFFYTINQFIPSKNGRYNEYSFIDNEPLTSLSYYRIRQVDFDYNFSYSKIVRVAESTSQEISVHPNPSNGSFSITFTQEVFEDVKIEVFSVTGQLVFSQYLTAPFNSADIKLNTPEKGTYLLKLTNDEISDIRRITIQ